MLEFTIPCFVSLTRTLDADLVRFVRRDLRVNEVASSEILRVSCSDKRA